MNTWSLKKRWTPRSEAEWQDEETKTLASCGWYHPTYVLLSRATFAEVVGREIGETVSVDVFPCFA